MKPRDQVIACAKLQRWHSRVVDGVVRWFPPDGGEGWFYESELPDYLHDLNAAHALEIYAELEDYKWWLFTVIHGGTVVTNRDVCVLSHETVCATAAQRTEAVLKCSGLWVQDEK